MGSIGRDDWCWRRGMGWRKDKNTIMDKSMSSDFLLTQVISKTVFGLKESNKVFLYPEDTKNIETENNYYGFPKEIIPDICKIVTYDSSDLDRFDELLRINSSSEIFLWTSIVPRRDLPVEVQSAFPGMDLHEILLWKAANLLPQGTRIGVLMPSGFLTNFSAQVARHKIFTQASAKLIINNIFTPDIANILGIHHSFKMSLLVLTIGEKNPLLKLFSIPESNLDVDRILDDLNHLIKVSGGKSTFGYVLREGIAPGESINFEANHPDLVKKASELETFGEIIKLGDVAKIFQGINPTRYSDVLRVQSEAEVGQPLSKHECYLIDGQIITRGSGIDLSMVRSVIASQNMTAENKLRKGDYCISFISAASNGIKITEILDETLPLIAASSVIVIRLEEKISEEQRHFIFAYLKSNLAAELLKSKSSSLGNRFRISVNTLQELPLPKADENLLLAIQNLNYSVSQFEKWKQESESIRDSLFSASSFSDSRLRFLTAGRLARQRQEAALRVEDFNFRIRTQFPHPIAYRWRLIETSKPDLENYVQILECAELTILYLAVMAILLAKSAKIELANLSEISKKLSSDKKQGTTFGEWKAILDEVDSKNFEKLTGVIPFYEVVGVLGNNESVKRLMDRRNDQAHKRGPKGSEIPKAHHEAKADLVDFLKSIDFLSEYRLRFIETTKTDSLKKITNYEYRDIQGDHPLAGIQSGSTKQTDVEAGSLYLVDRQEKLHLARPYLIRAECPVCGNLSTFCLEQYDKKKNEVTLYSMEHGHVVIDKDLVEAFQYVGLLK